MKNSPLGPKTVAGFFSVSICQVSGKAISKEFVASFVMVPVFVLFMLLVVTAAARSGVVELSLARSQSGRRARWRRGGSSQARPPGGRAWACVARHFR